MNGSRWIAGVCIIGCAVSVGAYAWLTAKIGIWINPLSLFMQMTLLSRLIILAIGLTLARGVQLAISGRELTPRHGIRPGMLLALMAIMLGAFGAAHAWWQTRPGNYLYCGEEPVPFQAFADLYLEMAVSLLVGFSAALALLVLHSKR